MAEEERPMGEDEAVRIVLTPEQREMVKRLSGKFVEAIELTSEHKVPEAATPGSEATSQEKQPSGPVRFLWRLSAATGIPRQAWVSDEEEEPKGEKR